MGYPHRSADNLDLQNRLARFLYSADAHPEIRNNLSFPVVVELSEAVAAVNAQFIGSKVSFRSREVNVFANSTNLSIHEAS